MSQPQQALVLPNTTTTPPSSRNEARRWSTRTARPTSWSVIATDLYPASRQTVRSALGLLPEALPSDPTSII